MRALTLPWIAALILSLTMPAISSRILPRNLVCANDGKTKAGTHFHRRDLQPLSPSPLQARVGAIPVKIPCIWCAAASATYLKINYFNGGEPGNGVSPIVIKMLSDALDQIEKHVAQNGDGIIPMGAYDYQARGFSWYSVNANNHQLTWGVVGAAVDALITFMLNYSSYGMAQFSIFDGENHVGTGTLGPSQG
ncbi:MAG: hypothetical protein LQ347_003242 [Umbilicaria vellea]|nr:MAG: hypothetical protein LQ347_003242 [Umbilicaria vellea]